MTCYCCTFWQCVACSCTNNPQPLPPHSPHCSPAPARGAQSRAYWRGWRGGQALGALACWACHTLLPAGLVVRSQLALCSHSQPASQLARQPRSPSSCAPHTPPATPASAAQRPGRRAASESVLRPRLPPVTRAAPRRAARRQSAATKGEQLLMPDCAASCSCSSHKRPASSLLLTMPGASTPTHPCPRALTCRPAPNPPTAGGRWAAAHSAAGSRRCGQPGAAAARAGRVGEEGAAGAGVPAAGQGAAGRAGSGARGGRRGRGEGAGGGGQQACAHTGGSRRV